MPQEHGDRLRSLPEHSLRYALFPGTEPKRAQAIEPFRDRISLAVCKVFRGGEIDLKPLSFAFDTRLNALTEHLARQPRDRVRQIIFAGRVLNGMTRQRTTITKQMAE